MAVENDLNKISLTSEGHIWENRSRILAVEKDIEYIKIALGKIEIDVTAIRSEVTKNVISNNRKSFLFSLGEDIVKYVVMAVVATIVGLVLLKNI